MKVLVCSCLVAKSCLILATPWTVARQAPSLHGILQARILEWVAISFSRGTSWSRNWTQISRIAGRCFTYWAMWDIFHWRHTHIQQISFRTITIWHSASLLLIKWRWIIIKVFILVIVTLSRLRTRRKRTALSCCLRGGRGGGGGKGGRGAHSV